MKKLSKGLTKIEKLKIKLEKHAKWKENRTCNICNYKVNEKFYGVDAAIALVDNLDKKCYINPGDFAIPESVFKDQFLEPIRLSGIKNASLIDTSELVFKVGHTTRLIKVHIDKH